MGRLRRRSVRGPRPIILRACYDEPLPRILWKDQEQRRPRAGPRTHFESWESLLCGEEIVINRVLRGRIVA